LVDSHSVLALHAALGQVEIEVRESVDGSYGRQLLLDESSKPVAK
jgi:hypothetical protein